MENTPRRSGRWTALPSWKRRRRSPGLFAPSVTINFQRSPKPSRPIRSSSIWTTARMIHRTFRRAAGRLPCRANWGSRRRSRSTKMICLSPILRVYIAAIASLALAAPLAAQSRLAADLARYEQDSVPVHKSRDLLILGDDQIEESRKQLKAGDDVGSLDIRGQY